jgi:hypothetical protein
MRIVVVAALHSRPDVPTTVAAAPLACSSNTHMIDQYSMRRPSRLRAADRSVFGRITSIIPVDRTGSPPGADNRGTTA